MDKPDGVKLKQSAVFKNRLPEIEERIQAGMTMKDIAAEMGFKPETFKKYYQRFKNTSAPVKRVNPERFSHAKNHPVSASDTQEPEKSVSEDSSTSFTDILDPSKRSDSVSEFMQARKPLGKGNKK
ncbi:hypothetical protein [Acinetobacter variabilis]|uniref:hypothetical protein n=1 Tax=Acinetobacter variabilis TaxID=70346 RepID=UPI0028A7F10D|nr:hypothetical protein [Acinetobacter variabilis]